MNAFRGLRNACLIQLAALAVIVAACSACSHERFDEWVGNTAPAWMGLGDGVCVDGELELFPPHCEPNAKTTTSGG